MNLDKKLELAHQWNLKALETTGERYDYVLAVQESWQYADAMEVEYNKRLKEQKDKIYDPMQQKIQEQELDQQRIDHLANEMKVSQVAHGEEWQPDWSQAPDGYDWWAMDEYGSWWFDQEPEWIDAEWAGYVFNKHNRSATEEAPSFNYQGDWKDSLRKKP